MKTNKLVGFGFLLLAASTLALCVFAYFGAVSQTMFSSSKTDIEILGNINKEIIAVINCSDDTGTWQQIIDERTDVTTKVMDNVGNCIAQSTDRKWSMLDVKVTTPFKYHGSSYYIKSSVNFQRDYLTDSAFIARTCAMLISIVLILIVLVATIIYTSMLRPYRRLYRSIENFESGDTSFKKIKSGSYTARVYNKFCDLRDKIASEKVNQNRIIASISHDIKTPLTSIMGYSEQLKKPNLSDERKERYINIIYDKSLEIRNLIDGFDEYLGYITHAQLFTEPYSTDEIMKFISDAYSYEAEANGINLRIVNNAGGRFIKIEKQKLLRVMGNLFTNSNKHFNKSVHLIDIVAEYSDNTVHLKFEDNGCGVEGDKLNLIFEPLYTSDEGRKVAGLGLSICVEIVESLGGKIWAEKSEYGGLAICMDFPEFKPTDKKGAKV